jgi:carbamoylphosphate synthase large subunit
MDYKGLKVLLLDGYGRQIPTLLKQLHELGCVITTVNDSKLDVGYTSRYPKHRVLIKGCREETKDLRVFIENSLLSKDFDVVFPVLEKSTDLMLTLQEEGKATDVKVLCAPRNAFVKAYDKQQTMRICMENGIPCPITKQDDETLDVFLNKVNFPLACKPRRGSGGAGFKKVESREQLINFINDGTINVEEYVIQEFIPQSDYQYGVYIMMDNNHKPLYTIPVQTCRWFPIDGGPGCFVRTINRHDIKKYTEELMTKLEWISFGHVSFIMDPRDNTPKLMEINGRIPAGIIMCDYAGCQPVKQFLIYFMEKKCTL